MWRSYFGPTSVIHGVDINPKCLRYEAPDDGIFVHIGNQSNRTFLRQLARRLHAQGGQVDIILDDGSHFPSHQKQSFESLFFGLLRPGGLYLVEDVHTSYIESYEGGIRRDGTFMEYAKRLLDCIHLHWGLQFRDEPLDVDTSEKVLNAFVQEVHFHDSVVVIRKSTGLQMSQRGDMWNLGITGYLGELQVTAGDEFVP